MQPLADLIRTFQDLVDVVPAIVQPLIVLLGGAVPFIEGETASLIGVIGGLHPIVAGVAAATGNFLAVLAVVLLGSRIRAAAIARRNRRRETPEAARPESKGRQRFRRWLVRFGVPGASLLGPLAVPTQITSAMLVASGTPRGWVLLWQAVAIAVWTTVATTSIHLAMSLLVA